MENEELAKLHAAIAGLEAQRPTLGNAIVEPAIAALKQQIAIIESKRSADILPAPAERRILTILFTDIVGSTALAGQMDPEDWREVIGAVHAMAGQVIQNNQGDVLQYLGDGLLAVFGLQTTSERDAENAVQAALDIISNLASLDTRVPIQMRSGVHTGMVVVGEIGSGAKKEFTATGDAMNLAARLQSAAPPRGVLISHDTFRYVRGLFDLATQPLISIKGKSEPLQTYLVLHSRPRRFWMATRGVAGIAASVVGRDGELSALQTAYQKAIGERKVVWAQLLGEAGIGKSRLLDEMQDFLALQPENYFLLRGRAFQGDEKQPFKLIGRTLFDLFQITEDTPLVDAEMRWVKACHSLGMGDADAHALGLLIGLSFANSPHISGFRNDPTQVKGRAYVISRQVIEKIRHEMPIIVLFEDLQWADSASWDYLMEVIIAPANEEFQRTVSERANGVYVLATARPEWNQPAALCQFTDCQQIDLLPLTEADAIQLAKKLLELADDIPNYVFQKIVQRSEGVPYYIEEIVNWFLDLGIIDSQTLPWRFIPTALEETPLPTTLQHLLLTRLGGLQEYERLLLQYGSIFGRHFWETGLQAMGLSNCHPVLVNLQRRGFVDHQPESTLLGDPEWRFHHKLQQEVAYQSLLKRERKELHRIACVWLGDQAEQSERLDEFSGTLAEHAEQAGERSLAAGYYLRAGEFAKLRGAFQEARCFFDKTIELLPVDDLEHQWQALLGRDEILGILGENQARQSDNIALLALAQELKDERRIAQAYNRQGYYLYLLGEDRAALQSLDASLESARRASDIKGEASALGLMLVSLTRLGELDDIETTIQQALQRAQEAGDAETLITNMNNISVCYLMIGDLAKAANLLTQQVELARQMGNLILEANGLANLGYAYLQLGLYEQGSQVIELSLSSSEAVGARRQTAYNQLNLGLAYWRSGRLQDARRILDRAISQLVSLSDRYGEASGLLYLGLVFERADDIPAARHCFTDAEQIFTQLDMHGSAHDALTGLVRCALLGQRADYHLEAASRYLDQVWGFLNKDGAQSMEFPIQAFLTCAKMFDVKNAFAEAREALQLGYQDLLRRAYRISDPAWRQSYLENVPEHQAIINLWEQHTE